MKLALLVAMAISLLVSVFGCGATKSNYVGTWKMDAAFGGVTIVLNGDGTGSDSSGFGGGEVLSWRTEGNEVVITVDPGKDNTVLRGKINDDGKSMTLNTPGGSAIFVRQ
jgi:hypothetical protein